MSGSKSSKMLHYINYRMRVTIADKYVSFHFPLSFSSHRHTTPSLPHSSHPPTTILLAARSLARS